MRGAVGADAHNVRPRLTGRPCSVVKRSAEVSSPPILAEVDRGDVASSRRAGQLQGGGHGLPKRVGDHAFHDGTQAMVRLPIQAERFQ